MDVVIRDGGVADVEALAALVGELQDEHVAARPEMFRPIPSDEVIIWLRELFQKSVKVWVAQVQKAVRGYLVLVVRGQPAGPFNFGRTWIELDQIAVHRACRRQGVARALVATARVYADAVGIRDVELTSWSFNQEAHRAFGKLGFVPKVVRFELNS